MDGHQPGAIHRVEPVVPHGAEGLGHIAVVPPLAAQRVARLPGRAQNFGVQVPAGLQLRRGEQADGAHQHAAALILHAPLVKGGVAVVLFPLVQHLGGLGPAAVGVPAQIPGHLRVAGPVVEHHLAVIHGQPPQQQPPGLQFLCAAMFHGFPHFFNRPRRMPSPIFHSLSSWAR